jgi:hypothetical protein
VALAILLSAGLGCKKLLGSPKLSPDHGPTEGDTEVTISVEDCGDHRKVKKVLFGTLDQRILSQNADEVKVRTMPHGTEEALDVILLLENNLRCNTGAQFAYQKMSGAGVGVMFEQTHVPGERRLEGWRPAERR